MNTEFTYVYDDLGVRFSRTVVLRGCTPSARYLQHLLDHCFIPALVGLPAAIPDNEAAAAWPHVVYNFRPTDKPFNFDLFPEQLGAMVGFEKAVSVDCLMQAFDRPADECY